MEAAMKMARQYFMELEPQQPKRINFIAREGSYHGTTLGGLSMSGHKGRRMIFEDILMPNIGRVSACYEYRGRRDGQTTEAYVEQLAEELDAKFRELGPETVCAFVAEPVVGAVSSSSSLFPDNCNVLCCSNDTIYIAHPDIRVRTGRGWLFQGHEKGMRQVRGTACFRRSVPHASQSTPRSLL